MKTMITLITILSSLVLHTVTATELSDSRDQSVNTQLSTTAVSATSKALVADNVPAGTECKAVCALPTAGMNNLKKLVWAN